MKLLEGKKIAEKILKKIGRGVSRQKPNPGLAVILVGKNKASEIYVRLKRKAAEKIGIKFYLYEFSEKTKEAEVIKKIKELNADKKLNGIIVQLPLPKKFRTQKIINAVAPRKDADGFHPKNLKNFLAGKEDIFPVLPKAIMSFLKPNFRGKNAVVLSNSKKFGEVMLAALERRDIKANYVLAGNIKRNANKIRNADIVISAVGKPGLITGEMIKKNVIVIDAGITKIGKKVLGDADFESVKNKASFVSPVPGGVGPVTIARLLENVYLAAKKIPIRGIF